MLQLSRIDWQRGAIVLGAAVVLVSLILAVSTWRRSRTSDPLKGLQPGLYQPTQHHSGETLPLPTPKR
jgi:hypothetical protein